MKRSGFTLVELLVSSSIFLVLVFVAFSVFEYGSRACSLSNLRHNLQSSATRVILNLQNDLRRSSYNSVTVLQRPRLNHSRDAMSFAAMSNWADPACLNATAGLASYDRHFVYYASDDQEAGTLIRAVVNDGLPRDSLPRQLANFTDTLFCQNDPSANSSLQLSFGRLSEDVEDFQVRDLGGSQTIRASLTLHREGFRGPTNGAKRHDQSYQMEVELTPQNTWPRL